MALKCLIIFCITILFSINAISGEVKTTTTYNVAKYDDRKPFIQTNPDSLHQAKFKESFEFYDIDGATPKDLRVQMKKRGTKWNDGKIYAALTTWDVRYDYDITSSNGKYYVSSIKTDVDIVFHLPRLVPTAKTPEQLTASWKIYIENLTKHELGHRDIAVGIGREIYQALASMEGSTNRGQLETEVKREIKAKLHQLQEDQVNYDATTDHGEKQGAVLY